MEGGWGWGAVSRLERCEAETGTGDFRTVYFRRELMVFVAIGGQSRLLENVCGETRCILENWIGSE